MIRYAVDNGVNYIDTAWPYHEQESEPLVGKALQDGYRDKVKVATKMPSWDLDEKEDLDYYLTEQLDRLGVDQIDFYLLHALNKKYWNKYLDLEVRQWLDEKLDQGLIQHAGFSFHDDLDVFQTIIDSYSRWSFCQIQYNYLNETFQAGRKGLKYANDKGLGVVIMEPLMGGTLAQQPPDSIKSIWRKSPTTKSPVQWALEWLWDQPEVSVVLSGMSTMDQVRENVSLASDPDIGTLSSQEKNLIRQVADKYRQLYPVNCTGCNYCMPCPNGVQIPHSFSYYNQAKVYDELEKFLSQYERIDEEARASACISCGQCEDACPQNLNIIDSLEEVADYFE